MELEIALRASLLKQLTLRMAQALTNYGACNPECRGLISKGGCTCGFRTEVNNLIKQAQRTALPEA
jgi:hypothetical protein